MICASERSTAMREARISFQEMHTQTQKKKIEKN